PQFVDTSRGHATLQILELGVLFAMMGWFSDSMWALAAGTLAERMRRSVRLRRAQRHVSGGVLIALGLAAAFSGARSKEGSKESSSWKVQFAHPILLLRRRRRP